MEKETVIGETLPDYSPELFKKANNDEALHDQAFETKPVSYLRGALRRFAKNKASIVGAIIIALIILYAIITPMATPTAHVDSIRYPSGFQDVEFAYALPYNSLFKGSGFWDGTEVVSGVNETQYTIYSLDEGNRDKIVDVLDRKETVEEIIPGQTVTTVSYSLRVDSYAVGVKERSVSLAQYNALVEYETQRGTLGTEKGILKPILDSATYLAEYEEQLRAEGLRDTIITTIMDQMEGYYATNSNVYYQMTAKLEDGTYTSQQGRFRVVYDDNGDPVPIYKVDEEGNYIYREAYSTEWRIRVDYFDYFTYLNGFEPLFLFGTNAQGQDIFLRLAQGTRFSLLLGVGISIINFLIGLVWGAVSGYYGGRVDLVMERITDIISALPSVVILTICGIQFTNNTTLRGAIGSAGVIILAFLVAFVYSGWIGTASTTRMQFYRYKGQEYVLASRTLGAKDRRLIFKHILPNAAGTLVTSSVLMIPGVIFSESSLSYLGIINFSTSGLSSIGTLLNEGQAAGLQYHAHVLMFPCVLISLLMICFNLFGNGLRDAFNTTLRGAEE